MYLTKKQNNYLINVIVLLARELKRLSSHKNNKIIICRGIIYNYDSLVRYEGRYLNCTYENNGQVRHELAH